MSLLFIDGFDHWTPTYLDRPGNKFDWTGGFRTSFFARRAGGAALSLIASTIPSRAVKMLASTVNTLVIGLAVHMGSFGDYHAGFRLSRERVPQATVTINTDQSISVKRGSHTGTVLGTSATGLMVTGRYYYLEFKIYVHDSAGTYEVRLDGVVILSGSGVDTQGHTTTGIDRFELHAQQSGGGYMYIDDLYVDDADILGDCRVDTLLPTGAGSATEWTPSPSGTDNYANVDEDADIDEDTTHNVTGVTNEVDTFVMANLTPTGTEIHGVAVNIAGRKDDAGMRKIQPICVIDSVEYAGAEVGLPGDYLVRQHIFEIPPDVSSGAWTESEVNAAEFGYEFTG